MFALWLAVPWDCHRIHLPKMLSCLGWWLHTWLSRKECVCHCGFLPEVQQKSARQHRSLTLGKKKQPVQHDKTVQQFLLRGYEVKSRFGVLRRIVYSWDQKAGEWSLWGASGKPIWFKSQKNTSSNKTSCIRSWHGQIRAAALLVELLGSRLHLTKVGLKMI